MVFLENINYYCDFSIILSRINFFQSRFNKHKKTSSYKEAIKQAMAVAKQQQNTTTQNIS